MQSDRNADISQLKSTFASIPATVSVKNDADAASNLIAKIADILGTGPASRPAVHPRPANAGLAWDELDEVSRQKYDAVTDCLDTEVDYAQLSSEKVSEALQTARHGLLQLGRLPQQGFSGMVQRSS